MSEIRHTDDVIAQLEAAREQGLKVEIVGGGSHRHVGAPRTGVSDMSIAGLDGIITYDPDELVLTARAGTRLAELEACLAQKGQGFLFEPSGDEASTIGGVIGASVSGPRRVSAGAVRDYLLGFEAVSGRGEVFKAGGKVVKNVTGFDLSKLVCGSWGRLAALTEVTLKVLPQPAEYRTLSWAGLGRSAAWEVMGQAMCAPADVAAAAYLADEARVMIRLEGFGPSVSSRASLLRDLLARFGKPDEQAGLTALQVWGPLHRGQGLAEASTLWRISVPRSAGLDVGLALDRLNGRWMADWAGGLIWCETHTAPDEVRALAAKGGGHAMLVRAPEDMRAQVSAFHPQSRAMAALSERVRRAFDPYGLFETGRFPDLGHAD